MGALHQNSAACTRRGARALTLLGRVPGQLREEYRAAGQAAAFGALSPVLTDGPRAVPYAALAARLGATEGAVRVAVHRLRRRQTPRLC